MVRVIVEIPDLWTVDLKVGKHQVRQLRKMARVVDIEAEVLPVGRSSSALRLADGTHIFTASRHALDGLDEYLVCRNSLSNLIDGDIIPANVLRWRSRVDPVTNVDEIEQLCAEAQDSWLKVSSIPEETSSDAGLRKPQVGALYAILAHWTVSESSATVVLPTGTGKTETMLSALLLGRIPHLLVIVPSVNLRTQISRKFHTLGKLTELNLIPVDAKMPVVGTLDGNIRTLDDARTLFRACNVVVSTMASLQSLSESVRDELVSRVSHLFVDEAHHISAPTWSKFAAAFSLRRVLQFTATPFRSDRQLIPGRVIYRYPLRKAQAERYFEKITFKPVFEYDPDLADKEIARRAIEQLESDLADGFNHIVMARTSTISRATELAGIYQAVTDRPVVLIHSECLPTEKRTAYSNLMTGHAQVVVCVDMLGEGFDLPELKIAALHDAHRGLGITLQFIGRFTRTGAQAGSSSATRIGPATVIANLADFRISESLSDLYSQDADWNVVLQELAEAAVGKYQRRIDFAEGFDQNGGGEIPIQNIRPKLSAEVYQVTSGSWEPQQAISAFRDGTVFFHSTNLSENVTVVVSRRMDSVGWADLDSLHNLNFDLTVLYFDQTKDLLFVFASDSAYYCQRVADAVTGGLAQKIQGMKVFRSLDGIKRLLVANLGLKHAIGRSVYFTMYAGVNVHDGLTEQNFQNKLTANLFGFGFEDGDRASVGCSYKGKIWAYRIAEDLTEWVAWCNRIGTKLIDSNIDPEKFLMTTMKVEPLTSRPGDLYPISIEWSENVWSSSEERITFSFETVRTSLLEVSIEMVDPSENGPLRFRVHNDVNESVYEISFDESRALYTRIDGPEVFVKHGRRAPEPIEAWFAVEPPTIRFHDGHQLTGNLFISAPTADRPFNPDRIISRDWGDTDLSQESQRVERRPRSIQRRVLNWLLEGSDDVIFDDDGSGESADIVTFNVGEDHVMVRLYHLKFVPGGRPRSQVEDLYQVCGQAQKSVHWKADRFRLIEHLAYREGLRKKAGKPSRFERGDERLLSVIAQRMRHLQVKFEIFVVQPGLMKTNVSEDQYDLLAATQLYLGETYAVPLYVYSS